MDIIQGPPGNENYYLINLDQTEKMQLDKFDILSIRIEEVPDLNGQGESNKGLASVMKIEQR